MVAHHRGSFGPELPKWPLSVAPVWSMHVCMCVYVLYACMYVYLYAHIHICIYMYMHIYIYVCTETYICIYTYISIDRFRGFYIKPEFRMYIYIHMYWSLFGPGLNYCDPLGALWDIHGEHRSSDFFLAFAKTLLFLSGATMYLGVGAARDPKKGTVRKIMGVQSGSFQTSTPRHVDFNALGF